MLVLLFPVLLLPACFEPPSGRASRLPCDIEPPPVERLQAPPLDRGSVTVSTDNLASWTELLASEELLGRGAGSEQARAAADLLARYFDQLDWQPKPGVGGYCQPYMLADMPDQNVVALLSSSATPGRWVLLGAHYDGQGTSPGGQVVYPSADDNASGVAALLELARLLSTSPVRPWSEEVGVVMSLFGGEERALSGSEAWLAAPPVPLEDIELMVNLDMVGRRLGDAELPRFLCSESSPALRPALARAAERVGLDWREFTPEEAEDVTSDHKLFAPHVPTVYLTSGDHPDRHTPRDTVDALDHEQIRATLAFLGALLAELFPASGDRADAAFAAWYVPRDGSSSQAHSE